MHYTSEQQFSSILVTGSLYSLKNYQGPQKEFLYVLEITTENIQKYLFTNSFKQQ